MQLIELFLPIDPGDGSGVSSARIESITAELAERFGGATSFLRSPAKGLWKDGSQDLTEDRIAIVEVLVEDVDHAWWREYRRRLEEEFRQEQILVRATPCQLL